MSTARREVREETSIDDLEFRWGTRLVKTPPYAKNKVARYYVARTSTAGVKLPTNSGPGHPEHHEFRWLAFAAAEALLVARLRPILEFARDLTA